MIALAALVAAFSMHGTAYPLAHASRVTSIPVVCMNDINNGEVQADGIYFPVARAIGIEKPLCWALTHWRTEMRGRTTKRGVFVPGDTSGVRYGLWVLGHELTHDEQRMAGRPFDEHEADCGGMTKFQHLRIALGITRHLIPPRIGGC